MNRNALSLRAYIFCLVLCFSAVFLWHSEARAHGPEQVIPSYYTDSGTLSVVIHHPVSNPRKHYIKSVSITKNAAPVLTQTYTDQPESSPFTYTYSITAKAGDILKVKADCSYFGSKTGELTVDR